MGNFFTAIFGEIFHLVGMVIMIAKCFGLGIIFIVAIIKWIFGGLLIWLFVPWPAGLFGKPHPSDKNVRAGFIPWGVRMIIVIANKIINIPKCFMWYALDTLGWIIYLPFRFIFWLIDYLFEIGIYESERKIWVFLDEIDYFLHGPNNNFFMDEYADQNPPNPDPDSMNLGFHIIHFPDAIMEACFSFSPYAMQKIPPFPMKEMTRFMKCATMPF